MADIRLLTFTGAGSAKGLVLGNKQGFYRDLGADIFNNNDFVRMVIWYSMNLTATPNATTNASAIGPEYVTNSLPSDYFYCGFKTPNTNFPDAAELQSKFCGYYCPPRMYSNNLNFMGWSGTTYQAWGRANVGITDPIITGNLTTPYTNNHILSTNYTTLTRATSLRANGGANNPTSVLGLELRNDNTMLCDYSTVADGSIFPNPSLSAMTDYINNRPFSTNSVDLASSAPYGQATAIFMYNPLNTVCIRVHGMVIAGFSY